MIEIKNNEFNVVQKLLFEECGITLNDSKKSMVMTRLFKRLEHYGCTSYSDYLKIVHLSKTEKVEFINALSTNETYFFREQAHFEFLDTLASQSIKLKVWSAAASMGAEAYSIAMVLDKYLSSNNWEVFGSDINTDVLDVARKGLYPFSWSEKIPENLRSKYVLKGHGKFENKMLIDRTLAHQIVFEKHNLMESNAMLGEFDVIFLRNVLLYFSEETKLLVIRNLLKNLKSGGYFIISLTETFATSEIEELKFIKNNIYKKV
jgi:chemotaxis protein methyltransferase CheR